MSRYVVLAVDTDEDGWATASAEEKQATYDADGRFLALLAERGGRVVGGAELSHSRLTRVLSHGSDGAALVTEGPFAETVEHLTGFYIVECDDLDADRRLSGDARRPPPPRDPAGPRRHLNNFCGAVDLTRPRPSSR